MSGQLVPADQCVEELDDVECKSCGARKGSGMSLCRKCFYRLPSEMRAALYRRVGNGYEEAYTAALEHLRKAAR